MPPSFARIAICVLALSLSGRALALDVDAARDRPFQSPRYPALRDAPAAAGTSIRAPGTAITNESSAETATGITGSGPRARRDQGVR